MKYTEKQWQELANKVALFEQLKDDIEIAKTDIREMNDNEIVNKYIDIKRGNNTTKTYPQVYTTELNNAKNALAKKYANDIISTTKENYTITLIPMKQAQTQANTITNEIVQMSCSKLKRMLASQTK
jgi:hypothetical protein